MSEYKTDEHSDEIALFEDFDCKENPDESVIDAVNRNDLAALPDLINKGKSINAKNNAGYNSIHAAVRIKNIEILEFLLKQPEADINAQTNLGETPLLLSTKLVRSEFALTLLAHGADVNIPNKQMETPLHVSVTKFHDVSLELIKRGADVNAEDLNMYTPLRQAVLFSDFEMVSMLVYYGACADVVDFNGLSPFIISMKIGDVEKQELLLELEVDYNRITYNRLSTLLFAFEYKSPFCLELIERGANVNYLHPNYNSFMYSYDSDEMFTKVWEKFDPKKIYAVDSISTPADILNSIIIGKSPYNSDLWVKRMETVLFSEKGLELLLHLTPKEVSRCFENFLEFVCGFKISTERLYKFLCTWFSNGLDCVDIKDVIQIYRRYGYDVVLELITHMEVILHDSFYRFSLPYTICDVNCEKFRSNSVGTLFYAVHSDLDDFYNLLVYRTPTETEKDRFYKYKDIISSYFPEPFVKIKDRLDELPSVPSLRELSRDSAKIAIIKKYGVKKCSLFYSILKVLPIPKAIEDILSFKVPVNTFSD